MNSLGQGFGPAFFIYYNSGAEASNLPGPKRLVGDVRDHDGGLARMQGRGRCAGTPVMRNTGGVAKELVVGNFTHNQDAREVLRIGKTGPPALQNDFPFLGPMVDKPPHIFRIPIRGDAAESQNRRLGALAKVLESPF